MALEQRLSVRMSQRLIMTPSLQQAIKLLQMSKLELVDEIRLRRHGTFVCGRERPAHLGEQRQLFFDDRVRQERLRGPAGGNLPM